MGVFGNYTLVNGTRTHNETGTDVIMNYTCGGIFLAVVAVGLVVNTCLICYYRKHRTSWIHKFYYWLAIAYWVYIITRGVPTTYRLLDPRVSTDLSSSAGSNLLYDILDILCYVDGAVITTIVALIVMLQYKNIHDPGWILLNGQRRFWKPALLVISCFYLLVFVTAVILFSTHLAKGGKLGSLVSIWNTYKFVFEVPLLTMTAIAPCVYVVTRIKLKAKERELDPECRRRIREDLKLVHVMIAWNAVWFVATITYLILQYFGYTRHSYDPDYYIDFICSNMEPLVQATSVACSIFFRGQGIWDYTFRGVANRRQGYVEINGP